MKIQDLAAKLGGMINAMFIIVNILSFNYLRFLYIGNLFFLTKKVEGRETRKLARENSMNPIKFNNFTQSKIKDEDKIPNIKLINQKPELKINPAKEDADKIKATPNKTVLTSSVNHIDAAFSSEEEIYFNYGRYLKSFITCGKYYKIIDKIIDKNIEITKDKMSIETLTRAMNYFYVKEVLDNS